MAQNNYVRKLLGNKATLQIPNQHHQFVDLNVANTTNSNGKAEKYELQVQFNFIPYEEPLSDTTASIPLNTPATQSVTTETPSEIVKEIPLTIKEFPSDSSISQIEDSKPSEYDLNRLLPVQLNKEIAFKMNSEDDDDDDDMNECCCGSYLECEDLTTDEMANSFFQFLYYLAGFLA